jgi:hypothetical protein
LNFLFIEESYHRPLSPIRNLNNSQPVYGSKYKRTLSPSDETNQQIHESKRTKSFDDDDDDDNELSELLDWRRTKQVLSQNSTLSQVTNNDEQKKPTVRKPTVRKLSNNQRKSSAYVHFSNINIFILFISYSIDHNQYLSKNR